MVLLLKHECLAVLLSYSTLWSKSLCSCVVAIENGFFVAVFTTLRTHCAVCQKTTFEYYFACKMIVHFVMLPLLLSGQAQLSSGLLFRYISVKIGGRYIHGRYYILTENRQQSCGRYTQIGRKTHSRKTQCRLYMQNKWLPRLRSKYQI